MKGADPVTKGARIYRISKSPSGMHMPGSGWGASHHRASHDHTGWIILLILLFVMAMMLIITTSRVEGQLPGPYIKMTSETMHNISAYEKEAGESIHLDI